MSNTSYEEVNGKKRKVWRSTASTTANMMSPEAAANYLQQAAEAAAAAAAAAAGSGGESVQITLGPNGLAAHTTTNSQGTESLLWMNPNYAASRSSSTSNSNYANTAPNSSNNNSNSNSINLSNLDLAALAKAGDLSALTSAAARGTSSLDQNRRNAAPKGGSNASNNKDSLPCSEAEMKALMSMFVEIMGMSMDTEKLGKSTASKKAAKGKKKGSSFMDKNGWPDPAIAAATGDLDALNALGGGGTANEDESDEEDSLPALEDMKDVQKQKQKSDSGSNSCSTGRSGMPSNLTSNATPITGRSGIAPVEWESLEQVAIEDAMEAEERARKAAKRREKKNRKKEKARKEAATKAAEEASKKREKAILSWRSKVVSACQSNEVSKLEALIQESPLHYGTEDNATPLTMAAMTPHLEFLLPHTVAKNRTLAERGSEARSLLANYVMNTNLPLVFTTPLRSGRTALHTACLYAEQEFVEHALQLAQHWSQEGEPSTLPSTYLQTTCQESGFAPVHYSVLSGSRDILEVVLKAGADVKLKTTDTHTWRASNGKGILARELADCVAQGTQDKILETHGLGLQEALSHFSSTEERKRFRKTLERMVERLKHVEQNGYCTPPPEPEPEVLEKEPENPKAVEEEKPGPSQEDSTPDEDDDDSEGPEIIELRPSNDNLHNSGSSKNKKKKKKKKKKKGVQQEEMQQPQQQQSSATKVDSASNSPTQPAKKKDPLVTALLGMGFTEDQINAAIEACGGVDRATADDLVVWILGEGSGETAPNTETPVATAVQAPAQVPAPALDKNNTSPEPAPTAAAPAPVPVGATAQPTVTASKSKAREVAPVSSVTANVAADTKDDESRFAAERLAAKREEKRRRNREWNNRAEARQKEEEQAKIAQALVEANRAKQRAALERQVQQRQQQMQSVSAQQGLAPASQFFPSGMSATAASSTGMMHPSQQYPTNPGIGMPAPPPPGHYNMRVPPPSGSYDGCMNVQAGTNSNIAAAAGRIMEAQPGFHPQHVQGNTHAYGSGNYGVLPPQAGAPNMAPPTSWETPSHHGAMYGTEISSQYPSIPDDSTVSSYGSGRNSVPSSYSANIPPGFRPASTTSALPPQAEESPSVASSSYDVDENPLGEMRATAREFVPSFGGNSASNQSSAPTLRHASSLPVAPVGMSSSNSSTSEPPSTSRLRAFSGADVASGTSPSADSSRLQQSSSLLGGVSSLLAPTSSSGQHLTSSFERFAPVTPSSEMSPVPPSAASSVTGISNLEENQIPLSFGGLDKSSSESRGPALLDTISSGLPSATFEGTTAASIWGGINPGSTANSNGGAGSLAGIPLAGFPSFSLTSKNTSTASIGAGTDGASGQSGLESGVGGVGVWGSSNLDGGNSGGVGSIW